MTLRDPGYKLVDQLEYKVMYVDAQLQTKRAQHQFPNGYRVDVVVTRRTYPPYYRTEYKITVVTETGASLHPGNELSDLPVVYEAFAANLILRDIAELE